MQGILTFITTFIKTVLAAVVAFILSGVLGEEPTPPVAAITPEDARVEMHEILKAVEKRRANAEEPSWELAALFRGQAERLEEIQAELAAAAPPGDPAYAEARDAAEAGATAANCLADLTEWAMADSPNRINEEDIIEYSRKGKRKFIFACAYAAPEIAEKITGPQYSPLAWQKTTSY